MIFERSLQRELAYTAGAVFMVLLTIILTTMMIRIVGFAASGQVDPRDVVVLIGLTVIGYLAVIMIVTLFVSILFVLTRWYRERTKGATAERQKFSAMPKMHALNGVAGNPRKALDGRRTACNPHADQSSAEGAPLVRTRRN